MYLEETEETLSVCNIHVVHVLVVYIDWFWIKRFEGIEKELFEAEENCEQLKKEVCREYVCVLMCQLIDGHYLLVEWGVKSFTGGECVI